MSYCRISEGDVYMYASVYGGIECCGCRLDKENAFPRFYTRSEALAHLKLHKKNGHKVPVRATKRLKEEIKEIGDTEGILPIQDPSQAKIVHNLMTGESYTMSEFLKKLEE